MKKGRSNRIMEVRRNKERRIMTRKRIRSRKRGRGGSRRRKRREERGTRTGVGGTRSRGVGGRKRRTRKKRIYDVEKEERKDGKEWGRVEETEAKE